MPDIVALVRPVPCWRVAVMIFLLVVVVAPSLSYSVMSRPPVDRGGPYSWTVAEAVDHLAAHALGRWPRGSQVRVLLPVKADEDGWPFLAGYFDRLARINDMRFQLFYPDDPVPVGKTAFDAYDVILTQDGGSVFGCYTTGG